MQNDQKLPPATMSPNTYLKNMINSVIYTVTIFFILIQLPSPAIAEQPGSEQ